MANPCFFSISIYLQIYTVCIHTCIHTHTCMYMYVLMPISKDLIRWINVFYRAESWQNKHKRDMFLYIVAIYLSIWNIFTLVLIRPKSVRRTLQCAPKTVAAATVANPIECKSANMRPFCKFAHSFGWTASCSRHVHNKCPNDKIISLIIIMTLSPSLSLDSRCKAIRI